MCFTKIALVVAITATIISAGISCFQLHYAMIGPEGNTLYHKNDSIANNYDSLQKITIEQLQKLKPLPDTVKVTVVKKPKK